MRLKEGHLIKRMASRSIKTSKGMIQISHINILIPNTSQARLGSKRIVKKNKNSNNRLHR